MLLIFFQGLRKGQELKNTALFKPKRQTLKRRWLHNSRVLKPQTKERAQQTIINQYLMGKCAIYFILFLAMLLLAITLP